MGKNRIFPASKPCGGSNQCVESIGLTTASHLSSLEKRAILPKNAPEILKIYTEIGLWLVFFYKDQKNHFFCALLATLCGLHMPSWGNKWFQILLRKVRYRCLFWVNCALDRDGLDWVVCRKNGLFCGVLHRT